MVGLTGGTTVYTQYWRVTDGRTDRQTSCHGIVRAMHMRRAVKMVQDTAILTVAD